MKIKSFETISSTNTYALEHFDELSDFCAIIAEQQTQGRGRFDRRWVSEGKKNIYLSFVLKPENQNHLVNLTQYLCVVIAKTIEKFNLSPQIKWPNDVLINGKKICGILCELKMKHNKIQGVVLGVGVNLNMEKSLIETIDRPATALNLEIGKDVDKQEFLDQLIIEFEKGYLNVLENGFFAFREDYLKRINFLGKEIYIQQSDGVQKEKFVAQKIDDNGYLIVLTEDNKEKTILSGDLIL